MYIYIYVYISLTSPSSPRPEGKSKPLASQLTVGEISQPNSTFMKARSSEKSLCPAIGVRVGQDTRTLYFVVVVSDVLKI